MVTTAPGVMGLGVTLVRVGGACWANAEKADSVQTVLTMTTSDKYVCRIERFTILTMVPVVKQAARVFSCV